MIRRDPFKPRSIERTPLRQEFFSEAQRDPYTAVIKDLCADFWARAYEQAMRDVADHLGHPDASSGWASAAEEIDRLRLSMGYEDRRTLALEWMTEDTRRREDAEKIIALGELGGQLTTPSLHGKALSELFHT